MEGYRYFKPTKWKVIFSLVPFLFFLVAFLFLEMQYFASADIFMLSPVLAVSGWGTLLGTMLSLPFEPFLMYLDLWPENHLFPDLLGIFIVAVAYSIIFYTLISLGNMMLGKHRSKAPVSDK